MLATTASIHASAPGPVQEPSSTLRPAVIKVMGLGGGGSNAINRMIELGISGVDFITCNTDAQALRSTLASTRVHLGPRVTRGLGAGGDPSVGAAAALESQAEIARALAGADMVFLAAGMGGGTGTGSIPVAAEISRSLGALTIAVVTMPFGFEMSRRSKAATAGIEKLRPHTDTLITVPNDRLLRLVPKTVSLDVAFRIADEVLRQGVQGIAELITRAGLINVDFAHVRSLMQLAGGAYLAIGQGKGPNKGLEAVDQALNHPLLDSGSIEAAAGVLVHFTGGEDLSLHEVHQAIEAVTKSANPNAEIVFGATIDPIMNGRAQIILVATGVGARPLDEVMAQASGMMMRSTLIKPEEAQVPAPVEVRPPPMEWVVADAPRMDVDDLDIPAFLRKRRTG